LWCVGCKNYDRAKEGQPTGCWSSESWAHVCSDGLGGKVGLCPQDCGVEAEGALRQRLSGAKTKIAQKKARATTGERFGDSEML